MSDKEVIKIADKLVQVYKRLSQEKVGEIVSIPQEEYIYFLKVACHYIEDVFFDIELFMHTAFSRRWWKKKNGVYYFSERPEPFLIDHYWIKKEYESAKRKKKTVESVVEKEHRYIKSSVFLLKRLGFTRETLPPFKELYKMHISSLISFSFLVLCVGYYDWVRDQVLKLKIKTEYLDSFIIKQKKIKILGITADFEKRAW